MTTNQLYRSEKNRMIAGVCGGVGEYLSSDPNLIRIIWGFLTLLGGPGLILYLIFWLWTPTESKAKK